MVSRINSSNQIKLSWLPVPSGHINAPQILGYIVHHKVTGALVIVTNGTINTWIELELLQNDTEYLFTVSGFNERGVGPNISLAYSLSALNASSIRNASLTTNGGNGTSVKDTSSSSNSTIVSSVPRKFIIFCNVFLITHVR